MTPFSEELAQMGIRPRGENKVCNEIDHPYHQGAPMDETTTQSPSADVTDATETETPTPGRLKRLSDNHPRATRVFAAIGVAATAIGTVVVTSNLRANKDHLHSAADHVDAALDEVASSVSSPDTES